MAAPAIGGTGTSPITGLVTASIGEGTSDRYRRDMVADAVPDGGAMFLMTCVTLTLAPGASTAGVAVTLCITRSGRTTLSTGVGRLLLASSASATSPSVSATSARTIRT